MWNSLWNTIEQPFFARYPLFPFRSRRRGALLVPSKPILANCYPASTAASLPGNSYSWITIESDSSARYHRYRLDYQREIHHDQLPRNTPGKVASGRAFRLTQE